MNDDTRFPADDPTALPDALRWQLRAMKRDVEPQADLWPGIASRLSAPPRAAARWQPQAALAATLVIALGAAAWTQLRPAATPQGFARQEAAVVIGEYDRALRAVPRAEAPTELAPAMDELDRSARDIRTALRRDPDSRLLLDQLRRTYALRLALSQRAVVS